MSFSSNGTPFVAMWRVKLWVQVPSDACVTLERERERGRGVKFIISNLNNNVNMQCKLQKMFFLSYHKPEIPESKVLSSHSTMYYAT